MFTRYHAWAKRCTWVAVILAVAYVTAVTALTLDGEADAIRTNPFFFMTGYALIVAGVAIVVWWAGLAVVGVLGEGRRWVMTFTWVVAIYAAAYISAVTSLTWDGEDESFTNPFFYLGGYTLIVASVAAIVWWTMLTVIGVLRERVGLSLRPAPASGAVYEGRASAGLSALTEPTAVIGARSRTVRSDLRTGEHPRPTRAGTAVATPAAVVDDGIADRLDALEQMRQVGIDEGIERGRRMEREDRERGQSGSRD